MWRHLLNSLEDTIPREHYLTASKSQCLRPVFSPILSYMLAMKQIYSVQATETKKCGQREENTRKTRVRNDPTFIHEPVLHSLLMYWKEMPWAHLWHSSLQDEDVWTFFGVKFRWRTRVELVFPDERRGILLSSQKCPGKVEFSLRRREFRGSNIPEPRCSSVRWRIWRNCNP